MSNKYKLKGGIDRRREAELRRNESTGYSSREEITPILQQKNNGDEEKYSETYPVSFTKGLKHNEYGLIEKREDYEDFCDALLKPSRTMGGLTIAAGTPFRKWESPLAGHYFTIQGADPDAVAMPPAPKLGRSELIAEMAAVYAMALVRDIPFSELNNPNTEIPKITMPNGDAVTIQDLLNELNRLSWFDQNQTPKGYRGFTLTEHEKRKREAAWDETGKLTLQTLFRGSTEGAKKGSYLSQFMLIGTKDGNGDIRYGTQTISQKHHVAEEGVDFMTTWQDWLNIQDGFEPPRGQNQPTPRLLTTPRDLASYVHIDQLYQAYLNACLIILSVAEDKPGGKIEFAEMNPIKQFRSKNSTGFATWGGPHILSLVTEVATRALRAVRRQKFQVHRRARPEVMAARLAQVANGHIGEMDTEAVEQINPMLDELGFDTELKQAKGLLDWVDQLNRGKASPGSGKHNFLLPMAFVEGSPMHPAYGAGHATVAGACVTMLKAFFETDARYKDVFSKLYEVDENGGLKEYKEYDGKIENITITDELDKLAANVSIGRNMAGVHYYSDYYDSIRLGERVAVSLLEEQMLTYNEPVELTFRSFDAETVSIRTNGNPTKNDVKMTIYKDGIKIPRQVWWVKDIEEYGQVQNTAPTAPLLPPSKCN